MTDRERLEKLIKEEMNRDYYAFTKKVKEHTPLTLKNETQVFELEFESDLDEDRICYFIKNTEPNNVESSPYVTFSFPCFDTGSGWRLEDEPLKINVHNCTNDELLEYKRYVVKQLKKKMGDHLCDLPWSGEVTAGGGLTLTNGDLDRIGSDFDVGELSFYHKEQDCYLIWEGYYSSYGGYEFEDLTNPNTIKVCKKVPVTVMEFQEIKANDNK